MTCQNWALLDDRTRECDDSSLQEYPIREGVSDLITDKVSGDQKGGAEVQDMEMLADGAKGGGEEKKCAGDEKKEKGFL